jgi:hypothetical protein
MGEREGGRELTVDLGFRRGCGSEHGHRWRCSAPRRGRRLGWEARGYDELGGEVCRTEVVRGSGYRRLEISLRRQLRLEVVLLGNGCYRASNHVSRVHKEKGKLEVGRRWREEVEARRNRWWNLPVPAGPRWWIRRLGVVLREREEMRGETGSRAFYRRARHGEGVRVWRPGAIGGLAVQPCTPRSPGRSWEMTWDVGPTCQCRWSWQRTGSGGRDNGLRAVSKAGPNGFPAALFLF